MKPFYPWINNWNAAFWSKVVRATSLDIQSLCVFRIVMGTTLLLFYFPTFSWISESPRAFFNPPLLSIANLAGSFPPGGFFILLDLLLLLSLVCVVVGLKARLATLLYVAASFVGFSFNYSFGKIDHYIMPYIMLLCMAFSGWGSGLAVLPDKMPSKVTTARSLSLAAVLVCFAFFTAGFEKALNWVDFDVTTSGFASWHYGGFYRLNRQFLAAPLLGRLPFWSFEAFDYSAVVFEVTAFVFLLRSRKAWRIWLLLACFFHLLNTVLLNIAFIANVPVYLLFLDYAPLYEKVKRLLQKRSYLIGFFALITLVVALRLRIIFKHQLATTAMVRDYFLEIHLYIGAVLWTLALVVIATSLLRKQTSAAGFEPASVHQGIPL